MRLGNKPTIANVKKKSQLQHFKENWPLLILCLPAILLLAVFSYLPMFGVVIAFKDYSYEAGILGSDWIGFDNFKFFFLSQDAWRITRNTVGYSLAHIVLNAVCSAAIALLMNEIRSRKAIKTYQTIMLFPNFLSWVVVGFITYILFNPVLGTANQVIRFFGGKGVDWYAEPFYWPFILSIVHVWKGIGMNSIIYYAALLGVDPALYEAATIDGASRWQKCKYISIPNLSSIITMMSILALGSVMRGDFGLFYQIPRDIGVLYPTTDVVDTYVYRGLRTGDIGITSAVGLFQSLVGICMIFITNAVVKRIEPDNAMF